MRIIVAVVGLWLIGTAMAYGQQRYLDEIFTDVTVTQNVVFGENYRFIPNPSNPFISDLLMDIYEPTGDMQANRACVVVLHDGDFLPKFFNNTPIGNNKDSSIVELSRLFAKRGYVVATPNYRLAWDPMAADADQRKSTFLNAVYRGINDAKTCVRYLKSEAQNLGVDPDKIVVYGQGSGGYVAMNYAALDRVEELEIDKFLTIGGDPMIDTAIVGGVDGLGGAVNIDNYPGFTNDVLFCVNAGGALMDSSWNEPGESPVISFHCPDDTYKAPFGHGIVIAPSTNENVVPVSGSKWAIREANLNGNNDIIRDNVPYADPYSQAAYAALGSNHPSLGLNSIDYEGLFPFIRPTISLSESAPWDWWDEATVVNVATPLLGSPQSAQDIHDNAMLTNPDMSAAKGRAYIDSIMGYLAPRLHYAIGGCVQISTLTIDTLVCEMLVSPSSNYVWDHSGTYTDTIPNAGGCDSVIVVNLTVADIDTTVTVVGAVLNADPNVSAYQWLDCDGGLPIVGATGQAFTATSNGDYAVILEQNGCIDTSNCHLVNSIVCHANFGLFPDPTVQHNWFVVDSSSGSGSLDYLWDWGDGTTSALSNPSHVYDTAGYYNICVTISDVDGCTDTFCHNSTYIYKTMEMISITVVNQMPNGVKEEVWLSAKLYPNPTTGQIHLDLGAMAKELTVNLFSPLGELIGTERLNGVAKFNYELPETKGVYLLQLINTDGTARTVKVVRE